MVSPAEIVRQLLADAGLVILPPIAGVTTAYEELPYDLNKLCYVSSMPDDPDQVVCIYDSTGVIFGRLQRIKTIEHPGIKIIIRSLDFGEGSSFASAIADGLDRLGSEAVISEMRYFVQSVYRVSSVLSLGEERDKKRQLWSIHARLAMQDRSPEVVQ